MTIGIRYALTLCVAALFVGCREYTVPLYSYFYQIPHAEWHSSEEYFFPIAITQDMDTLATYTVTGILRLEAGFAIEQLPIGVVYEGPDHSITTMTFITGLQESSGAKEGYNFTEIPFVIEAEKHFPSPGVYTYSCRHLLTDSVVRGVRNLGIWIVQQP